MSHQNIALTKDARSTSLEQALEALETEFEVRATFPAEVLAEAERAIKDFELPAIDRRDIELVTIDPASSTDLDQALHLERSGQGYVVHYAIADVPGFVALGGALDSETRLRGQTVYLPHRRISLHPEAISEDAGSLLPGQDRSAYLWTFTLDAAGAVTETTLERAVVKSREKLSYVGVQESLDAGTASELLQLLREVGIKRVDLERQRGGASLRIPSQEVECINGTYTIVSAPPLAVEDWNAQISLMTGIEAARIMLEAKVGLLRTMPAPAEKDIKIFRLEAKALGTVWDPAQPYGEFLRSLDLNDPRQLALMHRATGLFRGATYTAIDGEVPEDVIQAAIAAPYAHTTAPLRRLVDRFSLLICSYASSRQEVPEGLRAVLPTLPKLMGDSNRLVNTIERAAIDTVEAASLAHRVGERFSAVTLTGIDDARSKNGSPATGGTLLVKDPAVMAPFEGNAAAGVEVEVELVHADLATRKVLFKIIEA
ncbi:RNB domain-containing ribonuclease [Paeniglutamicibacter terrestris]|uniref:RNB domain-containing ribonuclease n=1 Tax=Paeniglutamicibacter terrestris TaxID=2723403 RepID=A0ABX1G2C7_9MICC|nr:RNB domain-containing ribonuclease [Paeniglutamicibacter terrestris]